MCLKIEKAARWLRQIPYHYVRRFAELLFSPIISHDSDKKARIHFDTVLYPYS